MPSVYNVRVFAYNDKSDSLIEVQGILSYGVGSHGGYRGSLSEKEDADGLEYSETMSGSGESILADVKIDGKKLDKKETWKGNFNDMPNNKVKAIEWLDISDRSYIDKLAGKKLDSEASKGENEPAPEKKSQKIIINKFYKKNNEAQIQREKAAGRIVLRGSIRVLTYDGVLEVQGVSDPNPGYSNRNEEYVLFILDNPTNMSLTSVSGSMREDLVKVISINDNQEMRGYDGSNVLLSINPKNTYWPSDTGLPLGQPSTNEARVLGGKSTASPQKPVNVQPADQNLANKIKGTDQVIRAKNTNMRATHSKNSDILRTLLSGTKVHVIDTYVESPERMWCKVTYDGATGWISYNTMNGSIK